MDGWSVGQTELILMPPDSDLVGGARNKNEEEVQLRGGGDVGGSLFAF